MFVPFLLFCGESKIIFWLFLYEKKDYSDIIFLWVTIKK